MDALDRNGFAARARSVYGAEIPFPQTISFDPNFGRVYYGPFYLAQLAWDREVDGWDLRVETAQFDRPERKVQEVDLLW